MTRYTDPTTGLPFDVDVDSVDWDENGEAIITMPAGHTVTIARPTSVGFVSITDEKS